MNLIVLSYMYVNKTKSFLISEYRFLKIVTDLFINFFGYVSLNISSYTFLSCKFCNKFDFMHDHPNGHHKGVFTLKSL